MPAICIVLLIFISSRFVLAQTEIRLAPGIGIQAVQSYVKEYSGDEPFCPYNIYTTRTYHLSLQADIRRNWLIFTSIKSVRPRIGYRYGPGGAYAALGNIGASCTSLSLGVEKRISTHKWLRIHTEKNASKKTGLQPSNAGNRYLLLFRLKGIWGISHDWVANFPGTQVLRTTNTSLFLGFGLQFFDRGKDRLQLSFIYSQGLKEIAEWDVDYNYGNAPRSGKIGSKGSFFATQLSYPFRLLTTLKK